MKTSNGSLITVLEWQEIAPELTYTVRFPCRSVRDRTVSKTLNSLSKDICSWLSLSKAPSHHSHRVVAVERCSERKREGGETRIWLCF